MKIGYGLYKPYFKHKGPINHMLLFEASHTIVQIVMTKPKKFWLSKTSFIEFLILFCITIIYWS
jgi:hypothetical protein